MIHLIKDYYHEEIIDWHSSRYIGQRRFLLQRQRQLPATMILMKSHSRRIDTTAGYAVFIENSLKIFPQINSSMPGEQQDYTYEWSFFDRINGRTGSSPGKGPEIKINETPGPYSLQYRVTDKANGRLFHVRTNVLVKKEPPCMKVTWY